MFLDCSYGIQDSMENPWELIPCPDVTKFRRAWNHSYDENETVSTNSSVRLRLHEIGNQSWLEYGQNESNHFQSFYSYLNLTFPCWDPADILRKDTFKQVVNLLNIYFTPVIIVIGTSGNLLSFLVFTITHLRRQSSSVFLASLAIADFGYLFALLFIWLPWIRINIFHRNIICQMVLYLEAVFTFLSVW